jgi:SAM-dependent methyltransferase
MSRYDSLVQRMLPQVEYHQNRYARELSQALQARCRWLDLGAGERLHRGWIGPTPAELSQQAAYVVGCDLKAKYMRHNAALTGACVAAGEALPFRGGCFDLVTANMVVEHLPEPQFVFKEVSRVLRNGGLFLFLTPNLGHPAIWLAAALLKRTTRTRLARRLEHRDQEAFPTFYRANTVDRIRRLAGTVALEVCTLETFSSWPFMRAFAPLTMLECVWIRLMARPRFAPLRSNVLACLRAIGDRGLDA